MGEPSLHISSGRSVLCTPFFLVERTRNVHLTGVSWSGSPLSLVSWMTLALYWIVFFQNLWLYCETAVWGTHPRSIKKNAVWGTHPRSIGALLQGGEPLLSHWCFANALVRGGCLLLIHRWALVVYIFQFFWSALLGWRLATCHTDESRLTSMVHLCP